MKWGATFAVAAMALALGAGSGQASAPTEIVFAANRAATVTGEIYRLAPNRHRVDLSRSPYVDTVPVVSPDGRRVGFFSGRSGSWAAYLVRIDGTGLTRLGPAAAAPTHGWLWWQPHGHNVMLLAKGGVWIDQPRRAPVRIHRARFFLGPEETVLGAQPWSPDGRVLVLAGFDKKLDKELAVTPQGHPLWHVSGVWDWAIWSSGGLLALKNQRHLAVYDEHGVRLSAAPSSPDANLAWSPDGRQLATLAGPAVGHDVLEVRTAAGARVFRQHVDAGIDLAWASDRKIAIQYVPNDCSTCLRQFGVDLRTGTVSRASSRWFDPLSPDRKLAIVSARRGSGFALGVAPLAGGPMRAYGRVPTCWIGNSRFPAADSLQFDRRSIVYESGSVACDAPFSNLYSVAPDGSRLHRITSKADQTRPALSPDGNEIAYASAAHTNSSFDNSSCGGSHGIRIANVDGSGERVLTSHNDCSYDSSPTWSPDGSTILFFRGGLNKDDLFTVPAAGGTPHDLRIAGRDPAWGPSKIAYVATGGIWTANPDGSDRVEVGPDGSDPAWSSDGRLAYLTGRARSTVVIGTSQEQLPFTRVTSLAWSPDGTRFAVTARTTKNGPLDLYTVMTNGTNPVRLTKNYDATSAQWR